MAPHAHTVAGPPSKKLRGEGGAAAAPAQLPQGELVVPLSAKRFACVRR